MRSWLEEESSHFRQKGKEYVMMCEKRKWVLGEVDRLRFFNDPAARHFGNGCRRRRSGTVGGCLSQHL